MSIILVS